MDRKMSTSEYQFFNLITRDSVPDIYKQFKYCGFVNGIKVWNVYSYDVRRSKPIDSRNTVVYCATSVMAKFKSTYPTAKVESIDLDKLIVPKTEKRESWNIHVKGFPLNWTVSDVKSSLSAYLDFPVGKDNYQIRAPTDRATGGINGYCTVVFGKDVEPKTIAVLRWVIHNRVLKVDDDECVLSARWHVNSQQGEKEKNKIVKPERLLGVRIVSIEKSSPVVVKSSAQ